MRKFKCIFNVLIVSFGVMLLLMFTYPEVLGLQTKSKAATVEVENIQWAFTQANQHPEILLIDTIDSAEVSIDIAIYSLTHPGIVDALKQAYKRGIEIRMIVDRSQSEGKAMAEALKILGSAGIRMKSNSQQHSGLMHLKMVIVDREVISTGSFNYSKAAATRNDENLMVIKDSQLAENFSTEFERMWDDEHKYTPLRSIIAN